MSLSTRSYHKNSCITFKSTKGTYGALSNMAPGFPLLVNGASIKTSEALYQSLRFPEFPEVQRKIFSYSSPISAKKYGRSVLDKTRGDWMEQRFLIMRFCLEVKLYQNYQSFSKFLLETGNQPIVEYTNTDKVWGATLEGDYYTGTNALGRLLMELREKVKTDSFTLSIPEIANLKLLGDIIRLDMIPKKASSGRLFDSHHQ
ncbi:NADAR family protein [Ekhidna sp.]|uniref:NADAR family protein n=1 Tax=Ekhidna sp. TaxID=2608089 RepID=UPI003296A9C2